MIKLELLPETTLQLQVAERVIKTGLPEVKGKYITENGTYSAPKEGVYGFDPVTVEVDMTAAREEGYAQGVLDTEAKNFWTKYIGNCSTMFKASVFPANTELTFEIPSICRSVSEMFQETKNLVGVKLWGARTIDYEYFSTAGWFRYNYHIKRVDLSECNFPFGDWYMAFHGCSALEEIIGVLTDNKLYNNNFTNCFGGCPKLRQVRFAPGAIFKSVTFSNSSLLSDASVESIIEGLEDLTGQALQTITFHKDVGAKLTNEQKAAITAKNWTLVY